MVLDGVSGPSESHNVTCFASCRFQRHLNLTGMTFSVFFWFGSCLWNCTMSDPHLRSEPKPPFPKLKLARLVRPPLNLADIGHPPVHGDASAPGVNQIQAQAGLRPGLPASGAAFFLRWFCVSLSRGEYDDTQTKRKDHACFNRCGAFDGLIVRRGLRNERQPDADDQKSSGRGGRSDR